MGDAEMGDAEMGDAEMGRRGDGEMGREKYADRVPVSPCLRVSVSLARPAGASLRLCPSHQLKGDNHHARST